MIEPHKLDLVTWNMIIILGFQVLTRQCTRFTPNRNKKMIDHPTKKDPNQIKKVVSFFYFLLLKMTLRKGMLSSEK